jgi:hypothetical protein
MRAGFEYYRAFDEDAVQNRELVNKSKLQIPVLVLAGDFYPAFGGDITFTPAFGVKALAENVNSTIVPLQGQLRSVSFFITLYFSNSCYFICSTIMFDLG